ncbi:MAG TPA: DUF1269 domain-containing protein [Candidatus Acidoferrum sp.]|nr:DUF1269 domain-containing protein [Candidatus Acidoferrum sp.]
MERMLVVVFDDELKAYDGYRALTELDSEGSISVHAQAVIKKDDKGNVTVKQKGDDFPIRTVGGTAIGALIGVLGGPIGLSIGAVAGTFAGSILDMNRAGVNADFLDDVFEKLKPSKWAIVADINEEWVTPVDTRMAALGGTVLRVTRQDVENEQDSRSVAALKADIAQLKSEQAKSRTDQKAKIQSMIDKLNKKLHLKLELAKQRSKQEQEEAKAKVEALEKKAARAKGEAKAKIEARIADIKKKSKESRERYKVLWEDDVFL